MEQLSVRLLLTAGILLLIAGVIFAILQVWLYTGLLWVGAFGCLMAALNFRNSKNDGGYSKAFLEAHREEITLHKAAKAAFDEAGLQKLPKAKELDAEFAELLTKKKQPTRTIAKHGTRCRNWSGHRKT